MSGISFSIIGTGSALPKLVVTNDDLTAFLDTSDDWVTTRTGIKERHIISEETVTQLAVESAKKAIEDAGISVKDIGYIVCPTLGGDFISPSLGCMVQEAIGADCPAFDLGAACSGFMYALDVAHSLLASNKAKNILLVAAEGMSRLMDWTDRSSCVLFGDGAGAVVLQKKADDDLAKSDLGGTVKGQSGLMYIGLTSQGNSAPLYAPYPRGNFPYEFLKGEKPKSKPESHFFVMDGAEVYKFAVNAIYQEIEKGLEAADIDKCEVSYVLLHQANQRIIDAAAKKLKMDSGKFMSNISKVGNSSAASIPILLDEANRSGLLKRGDIIVLSGFGAGLATGTAIIRW